jgi:hypothetical protein
VETAKPSDNFLAKNGEFDRRKTKCLTRQQAQSLDFIELLARPAGIEPATPAFGGREFGSNLNQSHPRSSINMLILLKNISIAIQPYPA